MRACTSPNSLAILLQESPASVLQKTSPLTLLASRKSGSAACVARFQIVPLGASGNGRVSQVCPRSRERCSAPRPPKALPVAQVDHLGVVRLNEHAPAVRDGHLAPDLHGLPGGPVIGAGEDFPRCDGQQCLWRPDRDGQVMDVRISDTAGDDLPRLAAVLAVQYAVYFEAGPDVLVVDRVDH